MIISKLDHHYTRTYEGIINNKITKKTLELAQKEIKAI